VAEDKPLHIVARGMRIADESEEGSCARVLLVLVVVDSGANTMYSNYGGFFVLRGMHGGLHDLGAVGLEQIALDGVMVQFALSGTPEVGDINMKTFSRVSRSTRRILSVVLTIMLLVVMQAVKR